MTDAPDGFNLSGTEKPHAFIQWKGTDVCIDFRCECGAHCHFDGYFAYTVKCPHCETVWEMPQHLFPRKADDTTSEYWRLNPQVMEPDEDHSDEVEDPKDGITRWVPHPVTRDAKP